MGRKEMERREMGRKEMGRKEMGDRTERAALRATGNVDQGRTGWLGVLGDREKSLEGAPCLPAKSSSQKRVPTLAILLLLSAVRKDMLLISFWTTKFCSSRLKFWWGRVLGGRRGEGGRAPVNSSFSAHGEDSGVGRDSHGTWTSR